MVDSDLLNIAAFARKAGVTVRTLRYYDRLGLVKPSNRTASGHRLYGGAELVRLQQVMTLKFMGFSLRDIRQILDSPGYDLLGALQVQQQVVAEKARRMGIIAKAIDVALSSLAKDHVDWESFSEVIKAIQMEQY